jgi:CobQ-like glutamine amidotransferase family enzyme
MMDKGVLKITMLYPLEMNIYGDHGNLESLCFRVAQHGYTPEIALYEPGDDLGTPDIILGGGGQDSGQGKIVEDLVKIGPRLREMAESGAPMLLICGLYQLFGHYFLTKDAEKIPGIGVFDAYTEAGPTRLIGNIITDWDGYRLYGYENHSGLTRLNPGQAPFAKVVKGEGNNGADGTEGARAHNAFGSYLHGPVLPKNPKLADTLIEVASLRKFRSFDPVDLDDSLAEKTREFISKRPR